MSEPSGDSRRRFLKTAAVVAASTAVAAGLSDCADDPANDKLAWLDAIGGTRRQLFDMPNYRGGEGLAQVRNYFRGMIDGYGERPDAVRGIVAMHGEMPALAFDHEAWAALPLSETAKLGRRTTNPAFDAQSRGLDSPPAFASIFELQQSGVTFILCNNALNHMIVTLSAVTGRNGDTLHTELMTRLAPGIIVVPAYIAASNYIQSKGFTYVYVG